MAKEKKIIISIEENGDCGIHSPPDMQIEEILDILATAVEAAADRADEIYAKNKPLHSEAIDSIKAKEYLN